MASNTAPCFTHVVLEGLLRGLEVAPKSPEMAEALRLCGDGENLDVQVPVERFVQLLKKLARARFPTLSEPEAIFEAGVRVVAGYRQTLLGQVQAVALPFAGPERVMRRIPELIGRNTNFGRRWSEQLAPREWVMHLEEVPMPGDYYRGMLWRVLSDAGVKEPRLRCEQPTDSTIHVYVSW